MTRAQLPNRRRNVTEKVTHTWATGNGIKLIVTFGFDDRHKVRELFCADSKQGVDMRIMIGDACMAVSLLLQHGHSVQDVLDKMAPEPKSVLRTLVEAAAEIEQYIGEVGK